MARFRLIFKVAWGEAWVPIEQCIDDLDGLLDANLADCCAFQGGFFIDIDGQPWSTDGTVDTFGMTATWFAALRLLQEGSARQQVWAWEESRLTLTRRGDQLEMEDVHHSGMVAMSQVVVPFGPFSAAVLRAGKQFAVLVAGLQAHIAQRLQVSLTPDVERKKLRALEAGLPDVAHEVMLLEQALARDDPTGA